MIYKTLDLITPERLDIGSKLVFLEHLGTKHQKWGEDIYLDVIKSLTLNSYCEYNSSKNSRTCYLKSFTNLFSDIKNDGFNTAYPIPVNKNVITNGAHRLAISTYLGKQSVHCSYDPSVSPPRYDYDFFSKRGCKQSTLLESTVAIAKYNPNLRVAIVWPRAVPHIGKIINEIGPHYYRHHHLFTLSGLRNLIVNIYAKENWLGNEQNNFHGAMSKAISCFAEQPLIFVVYDNRFTSANFKLNLREQLKLGKHSIHTTDNIEETKHILENVLLCSSLNYYNKIPEIFKVTHTTFKSKLNQFKEKNSKLEFVVDGGQIMTLFGIRDSTDIDLIIRKDAVVNCIDQKIDFRNYKDDQIIEDLSVRPKVNSYFFFNGTSYLSLEKLLELKRIRFELDGNKKDQNDIKLIKDFIGRTNDQESDKSNFYYIRLRFIKIIRRNLIILAKKIRLVDMVRAFKKKCL